MISDGQEKRKFCSGSCRDVHYRSSSGKPCIACGVEFCGIRIDADTGKYYRYEGMKACSRECRIADIRRRGRLVAKSGLRKGPAHHNWQGGKALSNSVGARGPNWKKQRLAAIRRDKACVDCGMTNEQSLAKYGRQLDVDHVVPFHNFTSYKKANALSNLQCRCKSCHRIEEAKRSMVQMVLPMQESEKRRHRGGYARGEKAGGAKLREYQVVAIRRRLAGGEHYSAVADDYPAVSIHAIIDVARGRTWRHIP